MNTEIRVIQEHIPPMDEHTISKVRQIETFNQEAAQVEINTSHILHGGMYSRTIFIPAGVLLTGALIKIATLLIIQGHVLVYVGNKTVEIKGYNVLPASANRKQAFVTKTDTYLTMVFPSHSSTIKAAEKEFTDEIELLMSSKDSAHNEILITGE